MVAGNPKVYGQLVQILAPYTRVIKEDAAGEPAMASTAAAGADATAAFVAAAETARPALKPAVRIRRPGAPAGDDAPM